MYRKITTIPPSAVRPRCRWSVRQVRRGNASFLTLAESDHQSHVVIYRGTHRGVGVMDRFQWWVSICFYLAKHG